MGRQQRRSGLVTLGLGLSMLVLLTRFLTLVEDMLWRGLLFLLLGGIFWGLHRLLQRRMAS